MVKLGWRRQDRGRVQGTLTFDLSVEIQRPPTAVFALLADIQDHEPIPRDAQVKMTKHPPTATSVGTRWDERVKIAPGCWMSIQSVATDSHPPNLLGMDFHSAWLYGHLAYTLTPSHNGTTLRQRETVHLRWLLRWLSTRVEAAFRRNSGSDSPNSGKSSKQRPEITPPS